MVSALLPDLVLLRRFQTSSRLSTYQNSMILRDRPNRMSVMMVLNLPVFTLFEEAVSRS
nr:hypothetical protein Q903MT_gene1137 [Picea sitchensis]